jgi:hypothetical protein
MSLAWWMRVVGALYLFLCIATIILRLPIRAEGPKGLLAQARAGDPTARYAVDTWFMLGLYFLVVGTSLLVFSDAPGEARALVWAVLGLEVAGIVVDVYKLQRGYDRKAPIAWLVIHSLIIASGLYLIGGA